VFLNVKVCFKSVTKAHELDYVTSVIKCMVRQ